MPRDNVEGARRYCPSERSERLKSFCYMPVPYGALALGLLLAETLTIFQWPLRFDQT